MANEEHLSLFFNTLCHKDANAWNDWRKENPHIKLDFSGADLNGHTIIGANLKGLDLSNVNLSRAHLWSAQLDETNLHGADLSDADFNVAHLPNANLSGATLHRANLHSANLQYTDLRFGRFSGARLRSANISEANLMDIDLTGADLSDATLRSSNLTRADLRGANLHGADLYQAYLNNASFGDTTLGNNDLSGTMGLETVRHAGPSTIGIDTLYRSAGRIPEAFLLGCGVPDDFIAFVPSHFGRQQAIQFYSCFISYSTKDVEFVRRLYSRMRDEHLLVWFAPEDTRGGQKLHEQIERAIQVHDRLLLVLSENSLQSEWVMTEIRKARKIEIRESRRKLFPIRLISMDRIRKWECFDADSGKDLAVEVREYFILDFSDWKEHDRFEDAFGRLLRDLRAEERNTSRA